MILFLQAVLGPQHREVGAARHFVGGQLAPRPARVAIGAYAKDSGFYLLSYDGDDVEVTDTFHRSIEEAQAQAEFEFGIRGADWITVRSPWPYGEREG
ncbi:hypothetical protein [Paludibaculum fermentans]|uniref:hypothetical protein n=1 Tax=Paludibaculum fermentans TaxID=1473598 RepID=UPI003EBD87AA